MGFLSSLIIHVVLFLQLQTLFVLSQNIINGSVPVGESLTASESQQFTSSWRSSAGDFAFGFRKIQPNDDFTLSIWFDKIPNKTIVWHAQNVNTTTGLVPDGSKITLTADRGLVLTDPRNNQLWSSSFSLSSVSVSRGLMTDAGNFGLFSKESKNSGDFLWSSFANPTDTLLPTQVIEVRGNLSSRKSETSFKKGRFRLRLLDNGNLQLLSLNSDTLADSDVYFPYYSSNTTEPPGIQLVFNQTGYMYVRKSDNSLFTFNKKVPVSSIDFYHRAVLHFDGVFAQYYHHKQQGSRWISVWAVPDNMCLKNNDFTEDLAAKELGTMACGFNNICILGENQRPKCQCPEKFVLKDQNDEYGDCEPDFEMQTCDANSSNADLNLYEFITLEETNWPYGDYQKYSNFDEEKCKASCLNDCFCGAAVLGRTGCWKKKFPLSYGHRDANSDTFVKVLKRGKEVRVTGKRVKDYDWLIITGSVLIGASAFVNIIFLGLYKKEKKSKKTKKIANLGDAGATSMDLNLRVFTYEDLVEATRDFMEELGRGAFGIVYKGFLKVNKDSEVTVAVKKLDRVVQESEKEFMIEVKVIGQIHHRNLVRLIGFCNEGKSRMIVYEFLPNGTLASFLFKRPRPSWEERKRIAVGVARGILYLHEECSEQIIHCDIKPQNILLDEYYNPRISDFGLAKLLMLNQTHTLTNIRGTKGYVAMEWFRNSPSPITSKVDVYSYGVMLLETVCCKKAVDFEDGVILIDWAYDCFEQGRLEDLIEGDSEAMSDMEMVERFVKIGILCIQEEPATRPNMRSVAQMLEGVAQVQNPPKPSIYSTFLTCDDSESCVPLSFV